jgi:hypothetical protein
VNAPTSNAPPVLLIVFNRPDHFRELLQALRAVRPEKIYIAADGPRAGHATDFVRCAATRDLVQTIDWPATILTHFCEQNLGCAKAVSSAITWFFSHEAEGIILEDDCIPAPDFFRYCAQLLRLYHDNPEVMHISGTNLGMPTTAFGNEAYGFSRLPLIWGWATWRRAWQQYRLDLTERAVPSWRTLRQQGLPTPYAYALRYALRAVARGKVGTWDYQWVLTLLQNQGLCITPRANLVRNIGFDGQGTHTVVEAPAMWANLELGKFSESATTLLPRQPNPQQDRFIAQNSFGPVAKWWWRLAKDSLRGRS